MHRLLIFFAKFSHEWSKDHLRGMRPERRVWKNGGQVMLASGSDGVGHDSVGSVILQPRNDERLRIYVTPSLLVVRSEVPFR